MRLRLSLCVDAVHCDEACEFTANAGLQARVERLESDREIERVARAEYDMVFPGEEAYLVLPPEGG